MPAAYTKTAKLSTGAEIPLVGLGTWQSPDAEVSAAVKAAINSGYTHIDCAWMYGNQAAVSKGIKAAGVPREKLFITDKLPSSRHSRAKENLDETLASLGTDYVDLFLIHWPVALNPDGNDPKIPTKPDGSRDILDGWTIEDTWKAMQEILKSGKAKAIGVSNFSVHFLKKLEKLGGQQPMVNQIEIHPYLPQTEIVEYCQKRGIVCEAYSPLGSTSAPLLSEPIVVSAAEKLNTTPAGICLSWLVGKGIVVLPKSVTPARIKSNVESIVELDAETAKALDGVAAKEGKQRRFTKPAWGVPLGFEDWGAELYEKA